MNKGMTFQHSPVLVAQAQPRLHLNDGASIILIALAPINPPWRRPGTSVYCAAKAALRAVAQTVAVELAPRGIRVNVVSPGPILTPIYQQAGLSPEKMKERLDRMSTTVPLARLGKPFCVVSMVYARCWAASSYLLANMRLPQ
ncbi:SDR family oxidoreductase [Ktedonobacter racemifer]|uniref:SDR family oxidoreductase n=1 Tax=Ktedonobacter racemifer TaxID=363277 RepID=UPI000948B524|nr:SDR family oxidoreductase [Ktedonobacter racemifer]